MLFIFTLKRYIASPSPFFAGNEEFQSKIRCSKCSLLSKIIHSYLDFDLIRFSLQSYILYLLTRLYFHSLPHAFPLPIASSREKLISVYLSYTYNHTIPLYCILCNIGMNVFNVSTP
uniref:Uncharacterized protein n=1 Tax=Cacopsylla melanoneura TaxID=428564 RepID=A0A8D9FBI1_9HEMI